MLSELQMRVAQAAYEGSPETLLMMRLGREIATLAEVPGGRSLASIPVSRLTHPSLPEALPVARRDRFRVLQALLMAAYVRHARLLPDAPPETRQ